MIAIISLGGLLYIKCFKSSGVDIAQSVNGTYEALLQATSTPAWSFGSQTGQLILKKDETIISKTDFEIANDGKQTPMRGHPVFVAQHATATCCRGCLEKWHRIPKGRDLTWEEQEYVVDVIMEWISREMKK